MIDQPEQKWMRHLFGNRDKNSVQRVGTGKVILTYQFVVSVRAKQDSYGYEGSVFDFGEGALEIATKSKECSRRENYPILIKVR